MSKRKTRPYWAYHPEWVKYVEKNCSKKSDEEIAAHLSKFTDKYNMDAGVIKRLRNKHKWKTVPAPGVRWYSPEIEKLVRDNWPAMNDPELAIAIKNKLIQDLGKKKAAEMSVRKSTVKHYRVALGCVGDSNNIPPTAEEIALVENLKETHSVTAIIKETGIGPGTVKNMFKKKKWKKKYPRIVWPKGANKHIRKYYKTRSNIELAHDLEILFPRGELNGNWNSGQVCGQLIRLNCIRTKEEKKAVIRRNVERGYSIFAHGDNSYEPGTVTIRNIEKAPGKRVPTPYIKTENGFELLKQVVWINNNGPIPTNHYVKCIDENEMNTKIDNLELVKSSAAMEAATQNLSDNYVIMNVTHHDPTYREYLKSEAGKAELEFQKARLKLNRLLTKSKPNG